MLRRGTATSNWRVKKGVKKGLKGRKSEEDVQARFDIAIGGSAFGQIQEEVQPETYRSIEVEDILARKCWWVG